MAWAERHGDRFRVRYRYAGRLVTDGTYDAADAAYARVRRLDHLNRAVKLRLAAPPPTLTEWTATWLPAHLAGVATIAKYESMLRCHILPAFGDHRLDAISRTDVKAFARTLTNDLAPVTVRSIITVLGLILREAIDEHYLLFDPTARLRLRDGPSEPRPTATPDQVRPPVKTEDVQSSSRSSPVMPRVRRLARTARHNFVAGAPGTAAEPRPTLPGGLELGSNETHPAKRPRAVD